MNLNNYRIAINKTVRGASMDDPVEITFSLYSPQGKEFVGGATRSWSSAHEFVADALDDRNFEEEALKRIMNAVVNNDGTIKVALFNSLQGNSYTLSETATKV